MLRDAALLPPATALIQFAGALTIVWYGARALGALAHGSTIEHARLLLLDGALAALGFTLAATLLKLMAVQSWNEVGAFAAIVGLRTFLKTVLVRERAWLVGRGRLPPRERGRSRPSLRP